MVTPLSKPSQLTLDFEARVDAANETTHGLLREIKNGLGELTSWLRRLFSDGAPKRAKRGQPAGPAREELEEQGRKILAWLDRLERAEADAFLGECARHLGRLADAYDVRRNLERGSPRTVEFAERLLACRRASK
jgi:hypothetical protein